jgi:hypothetical protein
MLVLLIVLGWLLIVLAVLAAMAVGGIADRHAERQFDELQERPRLGIACLAPGEQTGSLEAPPGSPGV